VGREVLHCPYCHGWEVRDQAVGVVATNSLAVHQALLIRNWSADVTVFGHTAALPSRDALGQLAARGIRFVNGEVTALEMIEGRLTGVRLCTGEVIGRQAVVVMPRFHARASSGSPPLD
jgi:thioredoxin reductase